MTLVTEILLALLIAETLKMPHFQICIVLILVFMLKSVQVIFTKTPKG